MNGDERKTRICADGIEDPLTLEQHQEHAKIALRAYYAGLGGDPNLYTADQDETLTDLLADLMHLFGEDRLRDALGMAQMHFDAEDDFEIIDDEDNDGEQTSSTES